MGKQEKVAAFMKANNFYLVRSEPVQDKDVDTWWKNDASRVSLSHKQATMFYDVAERARLETGKHVAFQVMDGADPKGIYDAFAKEINGA